MYIVHKYVSAIWFFFFIQHYLIFRFFTINWFVAKSWKINKMLKSRLSLHIFIFDILWIIPFSRTHLASHHGYLMLLQQLNILKGFISVQVYRLKCGLKGARFIQLKRINLSFKIQNRILDMGTRMGFNKRFRNKIFVHKDAKTINFCNL